MVKSQSAMEYLMTYGWAILAIAIVMVSLYSLGIFNTGSLQPTATPGSCQVIRTAAQTSLAGQCSNLIPKYVGQFNGANSYIAVSSGPNLNYDPITMVAWVYPTNITCSLDCTFLIGKSGFGGVLRVKNNEFQFQINTGSQYNIYSNPILINQWYFVVGTYDGSAQKLYVNGASSNTVSLSVIPTKTTDFGIGAVIFAFPSGQFFKGSIANIQIYNTSLDNATIKTLYQEGIGGTPIDVNHLSAWYPLNGNANDYSGNNNQGTPTNITWNANWQSGYTAPTT